HDRGQPEPAGRLLRRRGDDVQPDRARTLGGLPGRLHRHRGPAGDRGGRTAVGPAGHRQGGPDRHRGRRLRRSGRPAEGPADPAAEALAARDRGGDPVRQRRPRRWRLDPAGRPVPGAEGGSAGPEGGLSGRHPQRPGRGGRQSEPGVRAPGPAGRLRAAAGAAMRVVVTGGAGRLGRSVVSGLAGCGHEVISLDIRPPLRRQLDGVTERQLDLTDRDATQAAFAEIRPEALVHLAGIAVPFVAPEHHIFDVNGKIAFTTLEAAVEHGVRRILAASSPTPLGYGAPHGWVPQYLPIDEDHPLRPWNAYALSKQTTETVVGMFHTQTRGRVRLGVVRPCFVNSPDEWGGAATLQVHTQTGGRVRLGIFRPCFVISPEEWCGAPTQQGHTFRERLEDPALAAVSLFNYVDARDAAEFVDTWLRAAPEVPGGSVFYVGAADAMARKPLAELMPLYHPGTDQLAAGLTGTTPAFSIAKAERLLGWRPKRSWRSELIEDRKSTRLNSSHGEASYAVV